jgi:hypothetical protein
MVRIFRPGVIRRRRSLKGYFFLALFFLLNAAMAYAFLVKVWRWISQARVAGLAGATTADAARALFVTAVVWLLIASIFGLLAWVTRGRKEYVEVEEVPTRHGSS